MFTNLSLVNKLLTKCIHSVPSVRTYDVISSNIFSITLFLTLSRHLLPAHKITNEENLFFDDFIFINVGLEKILMRDRRFKNLKMFRWSEN